MTPFLQWESPFHGATPTLEFTWRNSFLLLERAQRESVFLKQVNPDDSPGLQMEQSRCGKQSETLIQYKIGWNHRQPFRGCKMIRIKLLSSTVRSDILMEAFLEKTPGAPKFFIVEQFERASYTL
jgi:hypothetical protein